MTAIVLDLPPAGWFVIAVMQGKRRQDWVALMIDVPPDQFRTGHKARSCWVKLAGEYRDEWSARDALLDLMVTRYGESQRRGLTGLGLAHQFRRPLHAP
jgi:hypothetical protein